MHSFLVIEKDVCNVIVQIRYSCLFELFVDGFFPPREDSAQRILERRFSSGTTTRRFLLFLLLYVSQILKFSLKKSEQNSFLKYLISKLIFDESSSSFFIRYIHPARSQVSKVQRATINV